LPTAIHEKINLHPITLAFRQQQQDLEQPFLDEYFNNSLPIMRFACIFAILIYGIFGILDACLIPEKKYIFWLFRYAVFCPSCLAILLFSFSPLFRKIAAPLFIFLEILGGSGILAMIVLAPPPVSFTYYAGLILVIMIGYTLVRLRFIWASLPGWFLVMMYEIVAIYICHTPVLILISNNFFFIGANIIGMVACYAMEYHARHDFYLKDLLQTEQQNVQHARDILEDTVQKRTAQLQETNAILSREIAERKQAQSQLLRHQKMESIGLVAGGVAHDLNNILSGVIAYPELLLLDLPPKSKLRKPIEQILESGKRAAAVVADLLTVARGVASQQEIICINDIIKNHLASPEHQKIKATYPDIDLTINLQENLPNSKCSSVHIQKVIMNLVNNGFEAIEGKGNITISTKTQTITDTDQIPLLTPGKYIIIKISDTGTGIPENVLHHIFEPFYTKKIMGRSGTGLGLAVVWNTLQEHNGIIDVESNDNGTTFTAYLPVTSEQKQNEENHNIPELNGTETILVIDDEKIQRDISRRILTSLGYRVETLESGEEALLYMQNHQADLLLLDMIMEPGINGTQTYREILKLHPQQKAIIASGFSETDDVKEALQLGPSVFLKKPYTMTELSLTTKEILTSAQ
jgi:signal transduction histidine kinase